MLEHMAVTLDQVDEDLWTDWELGGRLVVNVDGLVDHLLKLVTKNLLHILQLAECDLSL